MRALVIERSITRRDEKSIEKYLTEIARHEVLTPEEEVALFNRLENGDETALQKIVQHNLRFVVSVAKQYQHLGLKLNDLINEGNIGLIRAAERFDVSRGFKFISYAVWWIRQSILKAINEKGRKIRMPLNQQSVAFKIERSISDFLQKEERRPTNAELSEMTGFSIDKVKKARERYQKCGSIDAAISEGEDTPLSVLLEDKNVQSPDFDLAIRESQQRQVKALLDQLQPREAEVVACFYGIGRTHPMGLDDISELVGVSRERVRQIKSRGIRKLRRQARNMVPVIS